MFDRTFFIDSHLIMYSAKNTGISWQLNFNYTVQCTSVLCTNLRCDHMPSHDIKIIQYISIKFFYVFGTYF
jgi:hypothetical protein